MARERSDYQRTLTNWEITKMQTDNEQHVRNAAAAVNYQQIGLAEQQANMAATEQKSEIAREMLRARAEVQAAASSSGLGGQGVNRFLSDIGFTENQKIAAVEESRVGKIDQLESEKQGVYEASKVQPAYGAIGAPPGLGGMNYLTAALNGLGGFLNSGGFSFFSDKDGKKSETSSTVTKKPKYSSTPGSPAYFNS